MLVTQVNFLLSLLVVVAQITTIVLLVYLIFNRSGVGKVFRFISNKSILLAFIIALTATIGSLYYSEIAQFTPCKLCWLQRIFIYPQVIILGLAWWRKDRQVLDYSLIMIAIGAIISLYHNYVYYTAKPSLVCSIAAPCTQKYVTGFDYVTIPLMSLSALVVMGLLLIINKLNKK